MYNSDIDNTVLQSYDKAGGAIPQDANARG